MYFGDSAHSVGIQLADICTFLICRHLEGKEDTEYLYKGIEPHIFTSNYTLGSFPIVHPPVKIPKEELPALVAPDQVINVSAVPAAEPAEEITAVVEDIPPVQSTENEGPVVP
jgi:hypothetical protein